MRCGPGEPCRFAVGAVLPPHVLRPPIGCGQNPRGARRRAHRGDRCRRARNLPRVPGTRGGVCVGIGVRLGRPAAASRRGPSDPTSCCASSVMPTGRSLTGRPRPAERIERLVASSTPKVSFAGVYGGPQVIMLANAAANPNCPVGLLRDSAGRCCRTVMQRRVARSCSLRSRAALVRCAHGPLGPRPRSAPRESLTNGRLPARPLRDLAQHSNQQVRAAVARHPQCPETLIAVLAGDTHAGTRGAAASSPASSTAVMRMLSSDPDNEVAAIARVELAARGLI